MSPLGQRKEEVAEEEEEKNPHGNAQDDLHERTTLETCHTAVERKWIVALNLAGHDMPLYYETKT